MTDLGRKVKVQQFANQALNGWYAAGYWKDFEGRRILCEEIGIPFQRTWFDPADLSRVKMLVDDDTTDIIIEYSMYPELIRELRREFPHLKLHVRIHNAEARQHLHRNPFRFSRPVNSMRIAYGAFRLARQDRCSALFADSLLGISEYDHHHYWNWIAPSVKKIYLPYFSPWPELRPSIAPKTWEEKRRQFVCMPGGWDLLSVEQRDNFSRLARLYKKTQSIIPIEFLITDYTQEVQPGKAHVRNIGKVSEPWDLLCESRALSLLTDLGFGSKTTIVDASAAHCRVLVGRRVYERLANEMKSVCIPVSLKDLKAGRLVFEFDIAEDRDASKYNITLRNQAKNALIECFQLQKG
jgi:hypothetical protein